MDYEFKIITLEKELAHLRDMKELHSKRIDAAQGGVEKLTELTTANALAIAELTAGLKSLHSDVQALVVAMLGQHHNGKG